MDKKESIIDYFNGISKYNILYDNIVNDEIFNFNDINDEVLIYAKGALIANFFFQKKEQMVKNDMNVTYTSKIIDEELEKTVNVIATKVGNEYQIGHFVADAPTIIAIIRNKLAHGCYYIDSKNNSIIINKDDKQLIIDIDKMITCLIFAMKSCIVQPKTPVIVRKFVESIVPEIFNNKPITNEHELIKSLKYSKIIQLNLRAINGNNLNSEQLECFAKFAGVYWLYHSDKNKFTYIKNEFEQLAKKDNLVFNMTKSKIKKKDTPSKLVKLVSDYPDFYSLDLCSQVYILNSKLLKIEFPEYEFETYTYSNIMNLKILQEISENKNITREELFSKFTDEQKKLMNSNMSSMFIVNEVSRFNTLYSYPLDDIYKKNKYNLNRIEEFDFSKLDLSFVNPEKLEINNMPLQNIEQELKLSDKKLLKLRQLYDMELNNYERAKNQISDDIKKRLLDKIEKIKLDHLDEIKKNMLLQMKYDLIREDFLNNNLYFRNRAIIEGIRNAISHGNILIDDLNSSIPINNLIIFTDEYKGKIDFKLSISLLDFQKLFNNQNIEALANFLYPDSKKKYIIGINKKYTSSK